MTARYIDIHLLQTIPYANLNRDDLGSPKTVRFGNAERTRVSSQSWKRAVRLALEEASGDRAARTRRVPQEVAKRLQDRDWSPELAALAGEQVALSIKDGLKLEKTGETSVLLYLPERALDELAEICIEHEAALQALAAGTTKLKKGDTVLPRDRVTALATSRNAIINLFGRMLADAPSANVDGAVQVAHAFTVHDTSPEIDFFTAVDDLKLAADEAGSGHMNSAEFSAGTFYRYASVNLRDLVENLAGDTSLAASLVGDFLNAFITSLPGAKKNSTAPFTVPDLAYIAVRSDRPVSMASAFEAPVRAPLDGGYAAKSRAQLNEYVGQVYKLLGNNGLAYHGHAVIDEKALDNLGEKVTSFPALVQQAVERAGMR